MPVSRVGVRAGRKTGRARAVVAHRPVAAASRQLPGTRLQWRDLCRSARRDRGCGELRARLADGGDSDAAAALQDKLELEIPAPFFAVVAAPLFRRLTRRAPRSRPSRLAVRAVATGDSTPLHSEICRADRLSNDRDDRERKPAQRRTRDWLGTPRRTGAAGGPPRPGVR